MQCIKQLEAFLAKHQQHVSVFVLAMALIVVLDLVTPAMLLAETPGAAGVSPLPQEFRPTSTFVRGDRPEGLRFSTDGQRAEWSRRSATSTAVLQANFERRKNEQIKKLQDAISMMEKALANLRSQLVKVQSATPSTTFYNMDKFNSALQGLRGSGILTEVKDLKKDIRKEMPKLQSNDRRIYLNTEPRALPPQPVPSAQYNGDSVNPVPAQQ